MSQVVVCPKSSLPRDLDVSITISRPQTEIATDLTQICFLTPELTWSDGGNDRVQFFSSMESLQKAVPANSAAYRAASAFFARSERPTTLAIGRVFTENTKAVLRGGRLRLDKLTSSTDVGISVEVDGEELQFENLDFSQLTTAEDLVTYLNENATQSKITYELSEEGNLVVKTVSSGDGSEIGYFNAINLGDLVAENLGLSATTVFSKTAGYTPGDLVSEATLNATALRCAGKAAYGWILDAVYRDTEEQKKFADWVETLNPGIFIACTNAPNAYNTADTSNIGFYAKDKGFKRTGVIYHNNPQIYPDMSYLALALSVNYALDNSTITMKFKQLDGIEPSPLTESELQALVSRNINAYVYIGNTSRTLREGTQALDGWFTDSLVNLDNFKEELQVEIYNVFLRNKKLPYTASGQDKLVSAAAKICNRYKRNGTFADRDVESQENESGFETLPATDITPMSVVGSTASERAARIAPPILITAYEAGAFHKVSINVNVYN